MNLYNSKNISGGNTLSSLDWLACIESHECPYRLFSFRTKENNRENYGFAPTRPSLDASQYSHWFHFFFFYWDVVDSCTKNIARVKLAAIYYHHHHQSVCLELSYRNWSLDADTLVAIFKRISNVRYSKKKILPIYYIVFCQTQRTSVTDILFAKRKKPLLTKKKGLS